MKSAGSEPPALSGFEPVQWLGGGGFADVFLFRQRRPSREVAIKVLRQSVFDPDVQRQFEGEADLMAAVSEHPYIVTIHAADIAPDGRPYLVMEYYPKGHYLDRSRSGQVSVSEALAVGIRIASAVETAHERHIFHNDIKPSNILLSSFDKPGLTDFGISVANQAGGQSGVLGASLPYTAPEVIDEGLSGSIPADVFALGATLYTFLAGHSPFERHGGDNSPAAILDRVARTEPPPMRREDVPPSFELLVRQALSKDWRQRPQSARMLAVSLQAIEQDLGLPLTQMELRIAGQSVRTEPEGPAEDGTRYRSPVIVRPDADTAPDPRVITEVPAGAAAFAPSVAGFDGTVARQRDLPDATGLRVPSPPSEPVARSTAARTGSSRGLMIGSAVVVVLVAIVAAVVLSGGGGGGADTGDGDSPSPAVVTTLPRPLVPPTEPTATFTDATSVNFSWTAPAGDPVDGYRVTRTDAAAEVAETAELSYVVTGVTAGATPCITVEAVRGGRISSPSTVACGVR